MSTPDGDWLRVVCTYPDGHLTSAWFQAVRRARRAASRAGLRVRIQPLPASRVPADAEFVFVPDDSDVQLTGAAAHAQLIEVSAAGLAQALDQLVQQLVDSGRVGRGATPSRTVVVHHGFEAVGGRPRIGD